MLIGIAMIVFPGPAVLVIPAGLAILSLEFAWARQWLQKIRATADQAMSAASAYRTRRRQKRGEGVE